MLHIKAFGSMFRQKFFGVSAVLLCSGYIIHRTSYFVNTFFLKSEKYFYLFKLLTLIFPYMELFLAKPPAAMLVFKAQKCRSHFVNVIGILYIISSFSFLLSISSSSPLSTISISSILFDLVCSIGSQVTLFTRATIDIGM